jgi:hypothetical protein
MTEKERKKLENELKLLQDKKEDIVNADKIDTKALREIMKQIEKIEFALSFT